MSQDPMNKEQNTGSNPPANNQGHKNIKQYQSLQKPEGGLSVSVKCNFNKIY
jgi:hypothetical protein